MPADASWFYAGLSLSILVGAGTGAPVGYVVAAWKGVRLGALAGAVGGALLAYALSGRALPAGVVLRPLTIAATAGTGLMAGFFFGFSALVMRSLARQTQPCGMATMQTINVAVFNPWFGVAFVGTPAACATAMIVALARWSEPAAAEAFVGGALYVVGTLWVTALCNVPRNDALAAVAVTAPEAPELWSNYLRTWTAWNHVRTAGAFAAVLVLSIALLKL